MILQENWLIPFTVHPEVDSHSWKQTFKLTTKNRSMAKSYWHQSWCEKASCQLDSDMDNINRAGRKRTLFLLLTGATSWWLWYGGRKLKNTRVGRRLRCQDTMCLSIQNSTQNLRSLLVSPAALSFQRLKNTRPKRRAFVSFTFVQHTIGDPDSRFTV